MKMFNLKKLSWKMTLIVIIAVLIVAGAASAYVETRLVSCIGQLSRVNLEILAQDTVKKSNLAFTDTVYTVASLRNLGESTFKVDEYKKDAENYFDNTIRTVMNNFIYNIVDKSDYILSAYFAVHPDLAGYPLVREVYFEKTEDGIVPGEPQTYEEYMQTDSEETLWFYGAYNSGKPYWTPVHEFDGETMVSYVEPVIIDGVKVGVVGVDMPIDHIVDLIKDIKVFDTGFALLEDNYEQFFKSSDTANRLIGEEAGKLKDLAFKNPDKIFKAELGGINYMVAQAHLLNDYAFYILVPKNEFDAEAVTSITKFLVLFLLVFIGVAVISYFIGKTFSKPLVVLSAFMTKASATGDISLSQEDIEITSKYSQYQDEIGQTIASCAGFVARMTDVSKVMETIAAGDLTTEVVPLSDLDVMGNSLQEMHTKLNEMFDEIKRSTGQVSTGSKQLVETATGIASSAAQMAGGAQSLADGATKQSASVEELSSSIAEIAEKTKANADMTDQAAKLADTIIDKAEKGNRRMEEMITSVNGIAEASKSVSNIMETINGIAAQTNLLSLNAAIEAARAGEHGKGFAVVAEEVRKLAAQSEEAVKETSSIIQNSIQQAERGVSVADEMAASLAEIIAGISESSRLIMEIARASEEQSISISQINNNINQVAEIVQHNSALAEESAAAAEENAAASEESAAVADEMSSQSDILKNLISQFKLKDSGTK